MSGVVKIGHMSIERLSQPSLFGFID